MRKLIAILYASDRARPEFLRVTGRLKALGIDYRVWGEAGRWGGAGEQIRMAAMASDLDCTHILKLDAYDVLCLAGADDLLARFDVFGSPWVFCAENGCWPDAGRAAAYPECGTPWRFLNAGCYLAERAYLSGFMRRCNAAALPLELDDQRWFTDRYLSGEWKITVDTHCLLFQSLFAPSRARQLEWLWVNGNRTACRNRVTGTAPLVLHYNGCHLDNSSFRS